MGVAIVAVVLVIGFLYTHHHPPSRFRQNRATGWNSYFHIAQWGLAFTLAGGGLIVVLMWVLDFLFYLIDFAFIIFGSDYRTPSVGTEIFTASLPAHLSTGTFSGLLVGALMAYGSATNKKNQLESSPDALMSEYSNLARANGLEHLLFESMEEELLVQFTLKSRKVYVGKVQEPRLLHGDLENIVIIPMLSGYRDTDTQHLNISHNYREYYKKHAITEDKGNLRMRHFRIVIPTAEIDTASFFDIQTFNNFNEKESRAKAENI